MSVAEANDAFLDYATIVSKAGVKVLPLIQNIRKAIDERAEKFTDRQVRQRHISLIVIV